MTSVHRVACNSSLRMVMIARIQTLLVEEKDMLVLTRRIAETLCIGDKVTVTVLGVKGNQVQIGIMAPKEVPVHRSEIYERIQKEKAARMDLPQPGARRRYV